MLDAAGKHDAGELPHGGAKAGCDGRIISASLDHAHGVVEAE